MSAVKSSFARGFLCFVIVLLVLFLPVIESHSVIFISKDTELSMGKKGDKEVIAMYGLYQEKPLQLYVNQVGQKLVSHLADKEFNRYFFKVVDASEINAFALPGGYVYVTRGILATLNSEAELAGVLGHEIGHVTRHHGAKQMVRAIGSMILAIGGAVASPEHAGQWLIVSTQMFQQINLGYGREAELESDAHGMLNAYDAGYNPQSMVSFLRTLRKHEMMSGQAYHSFQATHPETKERIIKAQTMSDSLIRRDPKETHANRETYLKQIQGMPYGGKKHRQDNKNYKAQYIDIYQVKAGDTFQSIAVNELGEERKDYEIAVLNGKRDDYVLQEGEWLKIVKPGKFKRELNLELNPVN